MRNASCFKYGPQLLKTLTPFPFFHLTQSNKKTLLVFLRLVSLGIEFMYVL